MNEDDESDCITVQKPVSKAAAAAMAVAAPSPEPSFQPADTSEQTGSTTRGPPASGHCSKCHLKYRPALFRKRDPSKFGDVCAMCRFKHCVNQRTSGSGKHLPEDEKVDITEDVLDDVKRWLERMSAVHEDVSDEERRAIKNAVTEHELLRPVSDGRPGVLAETGDDTDHHSSPSPLAAGVANPAISRDEMKRVARAKTAAILAEEDSLRRRGVIAARRPLANYDKRDENQIIEASISRSEAADPTASESPAEDEIPSKPQAMDLETCSPELNRTLDVEATILSTGSTSTIDLDLSTGLHTQSGSSGGYRANPTAVTCGSKEAGTDASPTASANTLEEKYLCCRRCECPKYPLYFVISAGKDDICIDCKLEHLLEDTVRMLASQERAQVDEQLQSAAQGRIEQWANDVRPQYGGRPKFQCREQVFSRAICVIGRLLRDWHVVREKSLLTVHTSEHDCNIQLATPPPTAGLPTPDEGEGVEAGPDEASPHCGPELGSVDPKDYGGLACDQTTDQHHETQGELADDIHERSPEEIRADEQLMIHDRASSTDQSSQRRSPTPEEDFCRDETAMFPSSQLPGADEVSPNAFEAKEARSLKRKRTSKTRASKDERRRRKRTKLSKAQEALDRLVAASAKTGGDAASSDACDKTPAESNGVKWEASPGTSSYVGAPLDLLDGLEAVAVALREAQAVLPQDEYDALERRVGGAHFGNGEKVVAMIEGVFRLHNEWLGL